MLAKKSSKMISLNERNQNRTIFLFMFGIVLEDDLFCINTVYSKLVINHLKGIDYHEFIH